MGTPDDEVVRDYKIALTRIRDRLANARRGLDSGSDPRVVEAAALDIRFALEDLLLSALITHQAHLGDVNKSLRKADAGEARKRVERVNPDWWPNPQDLTQGGPHGVAVTSTGHHDPDFMTADEWGRNFGTVSDLLHARNPFAPERSGPHVMRRQLQQITERMWRLLKAHTLSTGVEGVLLLGHFDQNTVQVGVLTKVSDWPGADGYGPAAIQNPSADSRR